MSRNEAWTNGRRRRQAMLIRRWQPWTKSTGPRSAEGKAKVARNGYRGGMRRKAREVARVLRDQEKKLKQLLAQVSSIGRGNTWRLP
jgi:hypothetical protein